MHIFRMYFVFLYNYKISLQIFMQNTQNKNIIPIRTEEYV